MTMGASAAVAISVAAMSEDSVVGASADRLVAAISVEGTRVAATQAEVAAGGNRPLSRQSRGCNDNPPVLIEHDR